MVAVSATAAPVSKSHPPAGGRRYPWAGDLRAEAKTRVYKYILHQPAGVPLPKILEDVFGVVAADDEDTYQREYKFVRRFVGNAEIFKIDRGQDLLHVEPRPAAFHLTGGKNHSNDGAVYRFPKDWTRNYLDSFDTVTPDRAEAIERQFVRYRSQIEDRWNILKAKNPEPGQRPYALVPYSTLYNDERTAADNWRRYNEAWENATRGYSEAVFVTLTTDPSEFDSIREMADDTMENFNRLKSWLRRRLADRCPDVGTDGHRIGECADCERYAELPPYIKVLEWTETGRPHLHVIFFGVDWLIPQRELSSYWADYQAEVVDVRQVRRVRADRGGVEVDGTLYKWYSRNPKTGNMKNEKAHLGKYLDKQMPTGESVDDLQEEIAGDGPAGLWKTALYWATGKRFWTCSRSLKGEPSESDELARYWYVGAARFDKIPNHVMRNARILDRPPP